MKSFLAKPHVPDWFVIVLSVVLVLRIPSFFEPFSYGDEMIYLTLGEGMRQGLTLYKDIYDNKPPLLYLLAALAGNVFWFKAILAFLTTLPLLEGHIANAEIFMLGPIIGAFLILFTRKLNFANIFGAGALFGIATLFKVPVAFELPVIIVYWAITAGFKGGDLRIIFRRSLYLIAGFLAPIALTLVWFLFAGALKDYIQAAFLQNIGYLSSWRPTDVAKPFFARNLPLIIRGAVVVAGLVVLFLKRSKLSNKFIFLTIWVLFALFAITLSERPYPHYLFQVVAPTSFLFAILISEKTLEQSLTIIPLFLVFFVPFFYKFWYYSTSAYYARFLN